MALCNKCEYKHIIILFSCLIQKCETTKTVTHTQCGPSLLRAELQQIYLCTNYHIMSSADF